MKKLNCQSNVLTFPSVGLSSWSHPPGEELSSVGRTGCVFPSSGHLIVSQDLPAARQTMKYKITFNFLGGNQWIRAVVSINTE